MLFAWAATSDAGAEGSTDGEHMSDEQRTEQRPPDQGEPSAIDLTAPSSQAGVRQRRGRPWGWIAATVLATVAAAVAGTYAVTTYQTARSWEATADGWQQRAADLKAERDDIAAERTALASDLRDTEEEVAEAQAQLREVEDRVADVTAEREAARDAAARRADEVDLAATVGVDLSTCVDSLFEWLGYPPSYRASDAAWDAYFDAGHDIADLCGRARGDFDAFMQALEAAGR